MFIGPPPESGDSGLRFGSEVPTVHFLFAFLTKHRVGLQLFPQVGDRVGPPTLRNIVGVTILAPWKPPLPMCTFPRTSSRSELHQDDHE